MKHTAFILLLFLILCFPVSAKDNAASDNKKGIKEFEAKNYDKSAKHFSDAVIERPDSPELNFNLGTALSEQNEWDKALHQLGAAARGLKTDSQKAAAHYNTGNTLFVSGNTEEAIKEYKNAVKLDQSSEDIRHNLEVAIRKWQNLKKQQENKKSENKEENQDGEKKEEKEDSGKKENKQEDKEKENEGEENETPDQDEQQQQDQEQQQSKQQGSQNEKMTPEEAMRILDALNDEEKKALSLRRSQMKTDVQQGDDW